jgi:hypothetical protein
LWFNGAAWHVAQTGTPGVEVRSLGAALWEQTGLPREVRTEFRNTLRAAGMLDNDTQQD